MTAIDDFHAGHGALRRIPKHLNRELTNYSSHKAEQQAFMLMQNAAFRVADLLLTQKPGAMAEIMGQLFWVSPVKDKLEIVCSPDSPQMSPELMNLLLVSDFEGQSAEDLNNTCAEMLKWAHNPVYHFGNQDELDNVVSYWTQSGDKSLKAVV